jgi:asparagine synthase (glutamine-hydrolysing)
VGAVFGIVGEGSIEEVEAMGYRMAHRGSDQQVWSPSNGVIFGQRTWNSLESNPVSPITADIQLYNYVELEDLITSQTEDLDGFDATLLLGRLIQHFGIEGLKYVRGYFSLAYWDEKSKSTLFACDTAGFKSLYYVHLPNRFAFASEYKAILVLPDFIAEPNLDSIQYYVATRNFLKGQPYLAKLNFILPAEALVLTNGKLKKRKYWSPKIRHVYRSAEGHAIAVRDTLMDIVRKRSERYNRIGIAIGMGLDSAALLSALKYVRPKVEIYSFTVGSRKDDPELLGGKSLSKRFKTKHQQVIFSAESIPVLLPKLVWIMEDCGGREEALLMLQILYQASKKVNFLIAGYGGDTTLGGMPRHLLIRWGQLMPFMEGPLAELYQLTQSGSLPKSLLGKALQYAVYRGTNFPPPSIRGAQITPKVPWLESVNDAIMNGIFANRSFGYIEPILETSRVARVAFFAPFFDQDFIELSLTIPEKLKVGYWRQKVVLRRSMKSLLPKNVTGRPKAIQRIAHDIHLSDILDSMSDKLLTPQTVRDRGWIDPAYIDSLRRRPSGKTYPTDRLYRLWTLISIEIWARQFLDHRGAPWGFDAPQDWMKGFQPSH